MLKKLMLVAAVAAALASSAKADLFTSIGAGPWVLIVTVRDTADNYRDTFMVGGYTTSTTCAAAAGSSVWANWNTGTKSYTTVCVPGN